MRSLFQTLALIVCVVLFSVGCRSESPVAGEEADQTLRGPYLGMTPPGDLPVLFAPGSVSSVYWEHSGAVFTPDGDEVFWSVAINEGRSPRLIVILQMKRRGDVWTDPELAPFNNHPYNHINSVSPDGNRLYYFSSSEEEPSRLRVVERTAEGWGEPRLSRLNTIDNPESIVNEVHETRSGNIYCSGPHASLQDGRGIVRSKFIDGKYQSYEALGPTVNHPLPVRFANHSPTVDPDERFIIFVSKRPGGFGEQDLYISYRRPDDTWGRAINLGREVNSVGVGTSWPQLSPDGQYLFFTAYTEPLADFTTRKYSLRELKEVQNSIANGWGNVYWVDTSFVEDLRPKDLF